MFGYFGGVNVSEAQPYAGLSLVFRMDPEGAVENQGAKVVIGNKMQAPNFGYARHAALKAENCPAKHIVTLFSAAGFDVSPGTATSFSMEKYHRRLLPSPFEAACIDNWNQVRLAKQLSS